MFRSKIYIIALILGIQFLSFAENNLTFDYDYSLFREESNNMYVEFYFSFDPNELLFTKTSAGFEATGKLQLDVIDKNAGKPVAIKDFKIPMTITDTSGANKDLKLTGQINLLLKPGSYVFKFKASDFSDSLRSFTGEEEISIKSYPVNTVSLSTIQLGTSIFKSNDVENIFYKNTLEVTPNPSALFGNNISKLFYYLEIYNINKQELGEKYSVVASVAYQEGIDLKSTKKDYDVKTDSKVEFGSIDIADLPSNRYLLTVKLLDSKGKEITKENKNFYIFNSDTTTVKTDLTDLESEYLLSEYPKLKESDVDDEFNKAIYIMSDIQKGQYENLKSLDQKRMYMFSFWKGISTVLPKKLYYSRIEYSNANFKSDLREGWKTDRGRVYVIYGKYDEIERFPYEGSTRAYEIWTYNNLQGGVQFVFVDVSAGYGDYTLVHSSAQNEIRDENWKDKINIR